ncbi:cystatin 10-like [Nothobranchius furzeri]|uniref:cystatin 10-like n=1 Tax=Nothobranchius furzeri TaxID=105023 RepID=UPI00240453E3|nr:cystatin-C-like [Nothobranchius furzeri]
MPGGLSDIDPNSPEFQEAMNFAVAEYNRHTNDFYYRKVIRVLSAQSQLHHITDVVAGENIYMTLILARTPCRKTDPSSKHCPIHIHPHHAKLYQCNFVVFIALGMGEMTLTTEDCSK